MSRNAAVYRASMAEYLIRTARTHEWPSFRQDLAEVLVPAGFECTPIEGWGDFRMKCGDAEISFSGEEVGWQVVVEGSLVSISAAVLVEAIARQVAHACGEACEWIQIG